MRNKIYKLVPHYNTYLVAHVQYACLQRIVKSDAGHVTLDAGHCSVHYTQLHTQS